MRDNAGDLGGDKGKGGATSAAFPPMGVSLGITLALRDEGLCGTPWVRDHDGMSSECLAEALRKRRAKSFK